MTVEFEKKKTVPFRDLERGDTFKRTDDNNIWIKTEREHAVCLQDGTFSHWDTDFKVLPVTAKVTVLD